MCDLQPPEEAESQRKSTKVPVPIPQTDYLAPELERHVPKIKQNKIYKILRRFFAVLGPGLVTGAADDDPSGISTYSVTGAAYGYATLWVALLTFPLMVSVQLMCARLGIVTGRGLAASIRMNYPRWVLWGSCAILAIANIINIGADLGGMAEATELVTHVRALFWIPIYAVLMIVLMFWASYKLMAEIFKWMTFVLFAYIFASFFAHVDWRHALMVTLVPHLELSRGFFSVLVAILGTTISPYLFFWQAAEEVEEKNEKAAEKGKADGPPVRATSKELKSARTDTITGMLFSNLIMYFIILTTAATLHAHGRTDITTAREAAEALRPLAGNGAYLLFTLGLIGTGMLGVPVLVGSCAYAIAEAAGWRGSITDKPWQARRFYLVMGVAMSLGLALNLFGLNAIKMLFFSALINGLLAPPLILLVILLTSQPQSHGWSHELSLAQDSRLGHICHNDSRRHRYVPYVKRDVRCLQPSCCSNKTTRLYSASNRIEGSYVRNQEAARYARWAALMAGAIALVVAGVYAKRAIQAARAHRLAPAAIPATVQQQSAEFKFTKMEQNQAIFTIRASTATRFKDEDRSLLKDVWITIYGRAGDRNDNIHTRECSYEPETGEVHCVGDVEIDILGANPASGKPADKQLQVRTSNLSFNRDTGEASTPEKVAFESPQGHGTAIGVSYSSQTSIVRLEHEVSMEVTPSDGNASQRSNSKDNHAAALAGLPVHATGASLELRRNERLVVLNGPADLKQGTRELLAEKIWIQLDSAFHAKHVIAEGHPVVKSNENGFAMNVSAEKFEGFLSPAGWMQRILAFGNVIGGRTSKAASDHFTAGQVEIAMQPEKNLVQEMTISGNVSLDSHQDGSSRSIKTESLLVKFGAGVEPDQQEVETAETLAPAIIKTESADETTQLRAKKFVAQFSPSGHLEKLLGHFGVIVQREIGKGAPQTSSSAELIASFASNGEWDTLDQTGNVRFQQAERQATAQRAKIVRTTDLIMLDGSPVISDSTSRTSASSVTINQKSGVITASNKVVSTYIAGNQPGSMNLGAGPAHISADALAGSTTSGHVLYTGLARLWQGESVLDANQIEVWRDEKKLQATGNVVAVFPQNSSTPLAPESASPNGKGATTTIAAAVSAASPANSSSRTPTAKAAPTVWVIHAPSLTYWDDQSKAHLENGVTATSQQGELTSKILDAYLGPFDPAATKAGAGHNQGATAAAGRQLTRLVARGSVIVRQGDRRGSAQDAVYTVADQKFVLSGGEPTIIDANSDTTTGHSLTFFVTNDTILIDSQDGLRTLTKHRVEK